jgi:hypothetical protein
MGLGSLVAGSKSNGSLKSLLLKQWFEDRLEDPMAPGGYVRASAISSLCAREEILRFKHQVQRKVKFNADTLLIFLHGTSLHWGLQNHALPDVGVLYGLWKCLGCGAIHGSVEPGRPVADTVIMRPDSCGKCGLKPHGRGEAIFQYVEHQFVNDEYRITGHCDGFLVLPGLPGMGILEAKSAGGKSAWEVKHAPNVGHVIQAHVYMWFTGFRWAKLLYWVKGENGLDALKEHHVDRDEETIGAIKAMLTSIQIGLKDGTVPQRICATNDCPRAESCSVKRICFKSDTEDISP